MGERREREEKKNVGSNIIYKRTGNALKKRQASSGTESHNLGLA